MQEDAGYMYPQNPTMLNLPDDLREAVAQKDLPIDVATKLEKLNDPFVNEKMMQVIKRKKKYERDLLKNALFAVEKSKKMKHKINELNRIVESGVILSSIWNIGNRDNYAGDPNFYGNAPTQVVEQCILRLTNKGNTVVDPMAGSGTTIDVCKTLKRKCKGFDLSPKRKEIKLNNSCETIPLKGNSADLVFLHPPYLDMVKYSDKKEDLSRMGLESFLKNFSKLIKESKRILKNDKHLCILIGDIVRQGQFISLSRKVSNICENMGLEDRGYAIKITKDSMSQRRRGKAIYAELAKTKNLKQNHDVVLFFKKIHGP